MAETPDWILPFRQDVRVISRATLVALEDVTKSHRQGERLVYSLRGVSLEVRSGEFLTIMGPSGSGKSTLLQLLGLLDVASSGRVLFDGVDVGSKTDYQRSLIRRHQIGFVFQFFNLLPTLTALDNVVVPLLLSGIKRKHAEEAGMTALASVGLSHRRHHLPDQMSGGEMQRTAIARALINDPELLLCDEPTGNLDTAGGMEVLRLLRRFCEDQGRTIVMVTHDPQAAQFGDRLVRLRDGFVEPETPLRGSDVAGL